MQIFGVRPDETLVGALEYHVQTKTVRMIWVLTQDDADAPSIREALANADYTVASGERPAPGREHFNTPGREHFNTLVTTWNTYAADQDEYLDILPHVDIVVLDGMTELNMCAWLKWAEKAGDAGWYLPRDVVVITV